jgi:hypothetical protein
MPRELATAFSGARVDLIITNRGPDIVGMFRSLCVTKLTIVDLNWHFPQLLVWHWLTLSYVCILLQLLRTPPNKQTNEQNTDFVSCEAFCCRLP